MHIRHNWTHRVGCDAKPPKNTFPMKMVTEKSCSSCIISDRLGVRRAGMTFHRENDVVLQSSVSTVNTDARQRCLFKWQETLFQEQSMSAEMNYGQLKIEALFLWLTILKIHMKETREGGWMMASPFRTQLQSSFCFTSVGHLHHKTAAVSCVDVKLTKVS